jgi:L-serine dehydratase
MIPADPTLAVTPLAGESGAAAPRAGVFDLFRIGIGPSSSHTVGPMIASARFVSEIPFDGPFSTLKVELFGSLALTGKGHATDVAVILGLLGERPDQVDPDDVERLVQLVARCKTLHARGHRVAFDPAIDIRFNPTMLPRHPNAMRCTIIGTEAAFSRVYYSVGGGFVITEADDSGSPGATHSVPYPFATSLQLLQLAAGAGLTIAELQRANERSLRSDTEISDGVERIWTAMKSCVERGLRQGGELPGGLHVKRRAPGLYARLRDRKGDNEADVLHGMDWINLYALAVNEEKSPRRPMVLPGSFRRCCTTTTASSPARAPSASKPSSSPPPRSDP